MLIGELQWGRTREGAETRPRPGDGRGRGGFNGAAPVKVRKRWFGRVPAGRDRGLQWGRTREGAETTRTTTRPPPWSRFNGAAPVKVRKPGRRPWRIATAGGLNGYALKRNPTRLQWGRTREGAETRWRGGVCRWRPCFNGAAPVKVRKQHDQRCGTWRDGAGFNGAAPVKVRKRSHAGLLTAAWASFNGAAPVKVRKQP